MTTDTPIENETRVEIAEACGFVASVLKAMMSPTGTNGEQVHEALGKLESVINLLKE